MWWRVAVFKRFLFIQLFMIIPTCRRTRKREREREREREIFQEIIHVSTSPFLPIIVIPSPLPSTFFYPFLLQELFRDDQRVTLSLTRLAVAASGQYRCEVIAEHPSFRTEWFGANMTVLRECLLIYLLACLPVSV